MAAPTLLHDHIALGVRGREVAVGREWGKREGQRAEGDRKKRGVSEREMWKEGEFLNTKP